MPVGACARRSWARAISVSLRGQLYRPISFLTNKTDLYWAAFFFARPGISLTRSTRCCTQRPEAGGIGPGKPPAVAGFYEVRAGRITRGPGGGYDNLEFCRICRTGCPQVRIEGGRQRPEVASGRGLSSSTRSCSKIPNRMRALGVPIGRGGCGRCAISNNEASGSVLGLARPNTLLRPPATGVSENARRFSRLRAGSRWALAVRQILLGDVSPCRIVP